MVFAENRFILDVLGLVPEQNVFTVSTGVARRDDPRHARGAAQDPQAAASTRRSTSSSSRASRPRSRSCPARAGARACTRTSPRARTAATCSRTACSTTRTSTPARCSWRWSRRCRGPRAGCRPCRGSRRRRPSPSRCSAPTPEERERVERVVRESTGLASLPPLILLNANASDLLPLRRWPIERYGELAKRAARRRCPTRTSCSPGSRARPTRRRRSRAASARRAATRSPAAPRCASCWCSTRSPRCWSPTTAGRRTSRR